MENTLYIALSQQVAGRRRMNNVAQNIANMNTAGYKSQHMLFEEYLTPEAPGDKSTQMVYDYGQYRNFAPGAVTMTGNQLDLSLEGNGFFAIGRDGGEFYTRNGRFRLNETNQIVTQSGDPVLSDGGGEITIPPGAARITITANGDVSTETGQVGRIRVVRFDNPQELQAVGDTLFTGEAPLDRGDVQIKQGTIEGSNVNAMLEMTEMIEVSRQYQRTSRMIEAEHERQREAIRRFSRLS